MRKVFSIALLIFAFSASAFGTAPSIPSTCGGGSSACICQANNNGANSASCTINGVSGTVGVLVHTAWAGALGSNTVTVSDSSSGGGTADTFQVGNACAGIQFGIPPLYVACSHYVCKSKLAAGNFTFTSTASGSGMGYYNIDVEILSGAAISGCYDQSGAWSASASTFFVYTGCTNSGSCPGAGGKITNSSELAISFVAAPVVPTPVSPFSSIQTYGGFDSASMQNPTQGAALEATWSASSANYVAIIDTFSASSLASPHIRHSVKQQ